MITELKLKTKDNINIAMNYYNNGNRNVVIIAPGWCMTKDSSVFSAIAKMFSSDLDVLSMDFRGHGKSSGFFTFTAKETFDIDTVIQFAKSKNYQNIYIAGFSLGGAVALIAASQHPEISKVIAISAPTEFRKIENQMWKKESWGETFKKFELNRFLSLRMSIIPQKKIKPIDIVEKITIPTLFVASDNDPTVCDWHTKTLYEKATCPKDFKLFHNAYHAEDIFLYYKKEFSNLCRNWLKN